MGEYFTQQGDMVEEDVDENYDPTDFLQGLGQQQNPQPIFVDHVSCLILPFQFCPSKVEVNECDLLEFLGRGHRGNSCPNFGRECCSNVERTGTPSRRCQ